MTTKRLALLTYAFTMLHENALNMGKGGKGRDSLPISTLGKQKEREERKSQFEASSSYAQKGRRSIMNGAKVWRHIRCFSTENRRKGWKKEKRAGNIKKASPDFSVMYNVACRR